MSKLFPRILIVAIFLALTLHADTVVEEIVARVNDQIITLSEFQHSREQLKQEVQQQDPTNVDKVMADRDKDVLRDLIDQQLLLSKGKDLGITADTEVIKKLDDMRKDMKLDTMEDLEKAAQAQGISFEDFKNNIRTQIITQQVIGKEVGSKLIISKDEEKQFYEQHQSEMARPEQVRLSEILISTEPKAAPKTPVAASDAKTEAKPEVKADDPDLLASAKAKADDLLDQIKKGASFDDLAKKNSQGPSAQQGGDLGLFKRGSLAKELEDKTFAMKKGEVSDVIRTKQGFIILKVTEHQEAGTPTMADVEPRLQDALYMQKLQPALRVYLQKLREDAFIDVRPGYADTGASPNQTKPVETTTKEANAKELKKKKKFGLF
jgi:peptidyl-prolyl cis-trans isomerase SurA